MRFFHRLGATEVTPDTICNMAGHVALRYLYGSSLDGFDPRTAEHSACIVVWGANPHASAPHAHEYWLPEAPGKVVVIDPIRTPTAAQADIHLQPFPGSDAALAFALLHVIHREGLIDSAFVAAHVQGWEELEPTLGACDPAWGAAVTGVPAALIEEVAVLYARGPSLQTAAMSCAPAACCWRSPAISASRERAFCTSTATCGNGTWTRIT